MGALFYQGHIGNHAVISLGGKLSLLSEPKINLVRSLSGGRACSIPGKLVDYAHSAYFLCSIKGYRAFITIEETKGAGADLECHLR